MITQLRRRSQITLPSDVVKKMRLQEGDNLDIAIEEDKIVIKPVIVIDRSQVWFWSKEWQKKELEVDKQKKGGKIQKASDKNDLFDKLGLDKA
jgi:AbrB family looped-hinge helix DNA binding protein